MKSYYRQMQITRRIVICNQIKFVFIFSVRLFFFSLKTKLKVIYNLKLFCCDDPSFVINLMISALFRS